MFEFINSGYFYIFFGISYVFMAYMVYAYMRALEQLEEKVDKLEELLKK